MNYDNLLSGLAGAIIAVMLTEFWKLISRENELVEEREILKNYLILSINEVIERYILDVSKASNRIKNYPMFDMINENNVYDTSPLLNSDVFKEIGFNRLYLIFGDHKLHNDAVDLYNIIDFLRSERPLDTLNKFIERWNKLLVDLDPNLSVDARRHITENRKKNLKFAFQENLKHRESAARQALKLSNELINVL